MDDFSHLIEAVDFLCGIHRFVASSTGRIHGGSRNQRPQPSARLPRLVEEPNSSPPAGIPFIIATEPPGEEEPSGRRRALQPCAHITRRIVFFNYYYYRNDTVHLAQIFHMCINCALLIFVIYSYKVIYSRDRPLLSVGV